jgi:hypothetical protein
MCLIQHSEWDQVLYSVKTLKTDSLLWLSKEETPVSVNTHKGTENEVTSR